MAHSGSITVLLCAAGIAAAQDSPPVFRAGAKLVQVDVVAKRADKPAAGLTKEDFTLLDNGKSQTIAFFSVRSLKPALESSSPLPPGTITNRPAGTPDAARHTVILLDEMNTPQELQGFVIPRIRKFIDSARPRDLIALYTLSLSGGLQALQEFTTDKELLKRAANRLLAHNPRQRIYDTTGMTRNGATSFAAMNITEPAQALQTALQEIGRHLGGIPGRKSLVWVTAGFPLYNLNVGVDFREGIENATRPLNAANVAVYPVDARGLIGALSGLTAIANAESPGPGRSPRAATMAMRRGEPVNPRGLDTEQEVARLTGGEVFFNKSNAIEESIASAAADADVTYTLGFYPEANDADGRWHDLKVETSQHGVNLRFRRSYFAQRESDAVYDPPALDRLVQDPLDASQIGLRASVVPDPAHPGSLQVKVNLDLRDIDFKHEDARRSGAVDLTFYNEASGKLLTKTIQIAIPDDQYEGFLNRGLDAATTIKAASTRALRVIVQDKTTGAAGSLTVPLPAK